MLRLRTDSKGRLLRQCPDNHLAVIASGRHKLFVEVEYKSGKYAITIPARSFLVLDDNSKKGILEAVKNHLNGTWGLHGASKRENMDEKLTVALKLIADNAVVKAVYTVTQSRTSRLVQKVQHEFSSLKNFMNSVVGKGPTLGLGFGAYELAKGAAILDQHLTRVALSAGKGKVEVKDLREQLQGLSVKTGQNVGRLADGFDRIFSLTGNWDIAKKSIEAVNTAVTVMGANTDTLAESLALAQTFGKNLSKPGMSSEVLNKLGAIAPGTG